MRARVQERVDAIAGRLGQLDAHIIRIDALGKRITTIANVDRRQFNFDDEPQSSSARRPPASRFRMSPRSYRSWNNGLTCAMRSCRRWKT